MNKNYAKMILAGLAVGIFTASTLIFVGCAPKKSRSSI